MVCIIINDERSLIMTIKLIFITAAIFSFSSFSCSKKGDSHDHGSHGDKADSKHHGTHKNAKTILVKNGFSKKPTNGTKAFCPVMENEFTVSSSTEFAVHNGKHYGFCCGGCKPKFEKNPEKYIKKLK
jgi:YHS domain-containing protein